MSLQEELQLTRTAPIEIMPPDQFHRARLAQWSEYQKILVFGAGIQVVDDATRDKATEVGRLLQTAGKELTEFYKPIKKSFDDAKKPILDLEKADAAAIDAVKSSLASQVLKYQTAQEKIRLEREREERAAAMRAEEERRLAEAIELEAMGLQEEAAQRLEEEALPPAVIVSSGPQKLAGFVAKTTFKAQVDSLPLLVQAVAAGKVAILALQADQAWLNKQAVGYGEGLQIPGVSVKQESSSHFRS